MTADQRHGADEPVFERIAVIGIGLLGSSIARATRSYRAASSIALADESSEVVARASELGLGDVCTTDAAEAVQGADLVVLCVPVGACGTVAESISGALEPGAIVTDVGSVKEAVVHAVSPHIPQGVHFVAGHPVAGTEQSGPDAGFAGLFKDRWCILTPTTDTNEKAVATLAGFWRRFGSDVDIMDPKHHDLVLAITSHVPHLIAYNIVGTAADLESITRSEVMKFSAGGFRDFTRIAASDPTMWRDVFLNNKEAILEMLARFNEDLISLQRAIRWNDGETLIDLFTRTRAIRRGIIEAGQETAEPDFGRLHKPEPVGDENT
ncbi:MAG: prephenate/arogenate dehydrogenase family protein [Pseudomonadota bacterium]